MNDLEAAVEAPTEAPQRSKRWRAALHACTPHTLVYFFYLALAVWCFYPIFEQLDGALIGKEGSDVLRNAWGFWWFKAMLFERHSVPAFTVYLNYPRGMLILLIDPLNCLLSLPLQLLFDLPAAYNLYLVAVVAFSGYAAAIFAHHLTRSWGAALVAGSLYAFAPFVLSNSLSGNSEVVNVGWIPLFLLWFHRSITAGGRRTGMIAGTMLICTTLASWYYGYIAAVFAGIYGLPLLVYKTFRKHTIKPQLKALGWTLLLFALFTVVMVAVFHDIVPNVLKGVAKGGKGQDQLTVLAGNGVSLWDMFYPTPERWHRPSLYHFPLWLWTVFPAALIVGIKRAWSWALLGLMAFFLAFSYKTQWHPLELPESLWGLWRGIQTVSGATYDVFQNLPLSQMIRFPQRFLAVANLMLAVILACGLRVFFVDRPRLQPLWLAIGTSLAILLTTSLVHSARFHEIFVTTPVPEPAYVKLMADDPETVAVVNLPTDLQGNYQLYYQTLHAKPLLNFVDFVTSRLYYIDGKLLPLSYSAALYGMHLRGYDPYMKGYPAEVPPWPQEPQLGREITRLHTAGLRYVVVEREKFRAESLTEFESLLKPYLTLVLSAEGVDLYRLK